MRAVLALDQGSHASRACLFDESGALRATAQVAVTTRRSGEYIEHDATELSDSLAAAASRAMTQAPELQVTCAGLATQRSTVVCFERDSLQPLSAAISWQDRRNAAWLQSLQPQAEQIRARTGLPLSPHYGASKLRWCLDHLPAVQRAAREGRLCAAPLAAYLVARLAQAPPKIDAANASRTLLWDSAMLDWSPPLLTLFGVHRDWLPDCVPTQHDFGVLQIGDRMITLQALTGDQSAVPFAEGPPDEGTVFINMGTGAFIQRALSGRPTRPEPLLGSVLCAGHHAATYSLEGTVNGAGAAVSWFSEQHGITEAALWPALESLPDSNPLPLFINGIGGLGSPWWQPDMMARMVGGGPIIEQFAAVVESVAFMIAANFRLMAQRGGTLRRLAVAGGMSRSAWLCRRLAALLDVPVTRISTEAGARGVATLAAPDWLRHGTPATGDRFEPATMPAVESRFDAFLTQLEKHSSTNRSA